LDFRRLRTSRATPRANRSHALFSAPGCVATLQPEPPERFAADGSSLGVELRPPALLEPAWLPPLLEEALLAPAWAALELLSPPDELLDDELFEPAELEPADELLDDELFEPAALDPAAWLLLPGVPVVPPAPALPDWVPPAAVPPATVLVVPPCALELDFVPLVPPVLPVLPPVGQGRPSQLYFRPCGSSLFRSRDGHTTLPALWLAALSKTPNSSEPRSSH
jgi:hypothetical protein